MSEGDQSGPPPGGYLCEPGPAGPGEWQRAALERIAEAIEGLRDEVREMRKELTAKGPPGGG